MMAGGTDLNEVSLTDVVEGNEIDTLSMHTLVLQGGRGGEGREGREGRRGEERGGEGYRKNSEYRQRLLLLAVVLRQ